MVFSIKLFQTIRFSKGIFILVYPPKLFGSKRSEA